MGKRLKDLRTYIALVVIVVNIWFEARFILFGMLDTVYLIAVAGALVIIALMFWKKQRMVLRIFDKILGVIL